MAANKMPTSKDVAKKIGISQATVSRAFGDKKDLVKPELREQIYEVAERIGYRPNLVARGMISGKTNIIALVVGENLGPFYNQVITLFINSIQMIEKQCLIFQVTRQKNIDDIISRVIQFHVEAVVITASAMTENMVNACNENAIPVILFNRFMKGMTVNMVYTDPRCGGNLVAKYLYEKGHREIGYVRFSKDTGEEIEKEKGFKTYLKRKGGCSILEEKTDYTYEGGYAAGVHMLTGNKRPSAVFCSSDITAIGFIDAVRKVYGLKIPEALSIIGYDDIQMSSWKNYELTTVRQPLEELVSETSSMLKKLIHGDGTGQLIISKKPHIVERLTVAQNRK